MVDGCMKECLIRPSNITLVEMGGKREKWTLTVTWHGITVRKRAFAPFAYCPVDRLKLVPATDHHSCCILNFRNAVYTTSCHLGKET